MSDNSVIKGGEFLIKETKANNIFIPEDFDEEQRMIADTCSDFIKQEIEPILDRIEKQEEGLSASLMEKAGELGLLGISVPEDLGGGCQHQLACHLLSQSEYFHFQLLLR